MIDLHNHILPGIDDGSDGIETSHAMAEAFLDAGVTHVCATPHIRPGMFNNSEARIREVFARTAATFSERGLQLGLGIGAEYYFDSSFSDKLLSHESLVTFGDHGKHVLVEFDPIMKPLNLPELVFRMKMEGLTPVMAHPERYAWVADDVGFIETLVGGGMLMQGTLGPLAGIWGGRSRKTLKGLLEADLIHLMSSDAHSPSNVKTYFSVALERLRDIVGRERAELLLTDNPRKIMEGQPV